MILDLDALEPRRYLFRLRLTGPARFPFFHGGALRGLVSRALGQHQLPAGLLPVVCEAGRVRFRAGDAYHLGLTLVGEPESWVEKLEAGLRRIGSQRPRGARPRLGGNFRVEGVEALPAVDLARRARALGEEVRLVFVSPFRLKLPPELQTKGEGHLHGGCFPLDHFFDRLARRLFLLAHGRYPTAEERDAFPPLPAAATADPSRLFWLDVPVSKKRGRGRTLGGVVGEVRLRGVPAAWRAVLAAGQHAHAGASLAFGLGRYLAAGPEGMEEALAANPFRPARSLLAEVLARRGRGGPPPDSPLVVRDPAAQQAAARVLAGPVEAFLEDSSEAYRRGHSAPGAPAALRRAQEQGYTHLLHTELRSLYGFVDRRRLVQRLRALFPQEPLRMLVEAWLESPEEVARPRTRFTQSPGLPTGGPLSPLLVRLCLDQLEDDMGAGCRLVRSGREFLVLGREATGREPAQSVPSAFGRLSA